MICAQILGNASSTLTLYCEIMLAKHSMQVLLLKSPTKV